MSAARPLPGPDPASLLPAPSAVFVGRSSRVEAVAGVGVSVLVCAVLAQRALAGGSPLVGLGVVLAPFVAGWGFVLASAFAVRVVVWPDRLEVMNRWFRRRLVRWSEVTGVRVVEGSCSKLVVSVAGEDVSLHALKGRGASERLIGELVAARKMIASAATAASSR